MRTKKRTHATIGRRTHATRYRVGFAHDECASFEECNGESRPLTEDEYQANEYMACPDHPRGDTTNDRHENGVGYCARCGKQYEPIPYSEYLAYYGNPERHVYLMTIVQKQCPCCESWQTVGGTGGIDMMDDDPGVDRINCGSSVHDPEWLTPEAIAQLPGYLREVAQEDLNEARHRKGAA